MQGDLHITKGTSCEPTAAQSELFYSFRFFKGEREIFKKKENLPLSEHSEKYRVVPNAGAHPGPWRSDLSPHLDFIMDMAEKPWLREMYIMKCAQSGGSEVMYNYEAKAAVNDPGTALFVMPTETDKTKIFEEKLIPMFEETIPLRNIMSDNPDDTSKRRIKCKNGNLIYGAWANSTSALASFKVDRGYADELGKWPPLVGKETSPLKLLRKRFRTKKNTYKLFAVSTPTTETDEISIAFNEAVVRYRFHVKCPDCGCEQLMVLDRIDFPKDTDAKTVEQEELARFICEGCGGLWDDEKTNEAARRAHRESENKGWKSDNKKIKRPKTIAFHIPSFFIFDVSLSEIAACLIRSKTDRAALIDLYNDYMAEPFVESAEGEGITEDLLYDRRKDYCPEGADWVVPMAASVIVTTVDFQKNRLELESIAYGMGLESWGIEHKTFPCDPSNLEEVTLILDTYLKKKFKHESGIDLKIAIMGIDSGYLSEIVYKYVKPRQARRVYAIKGMETIGKALYKFQKIDRSQKRGKSKKDIYGINLCIVGTETAKDQLYHWMQLEAHGPGFMHYHTGYSHDYFRGLTAEHRVPKGKTTKWEKKSKSRPNEPVDLRVYSYAMIETLSPDFEQLNIEIAQIAQKEKTTQKPNRPVVVNGLRK